jgi:hypothetical protein
MTITEKILCPLPDIGYCIYNRCPYWDAARQECDADGLRSQESRDPGIIEGPCNIMWTEDLD